jgi:hypothetical protein
MEETTMADETKPETPKDPEIEKLEKEKQKQTLLAEIATKKKEALAATFPSTVTPIEAKTEIDDKAIIEAHILAYQSLDRAAQKIVDKISPALSAAGVLIHNAEDLEAVGAYRAFRGQMTQLGKEYDAIAPADAALEFISAVVGVTAAAKSVIDLLALFRTQRAIKGVDIVIDDLPFFSEVAGRLVAKGKKVYVPQLYPLDIDPDMSAEVQAILNEVRARAGEAASRVKAGTPDEARLKQLDEILAGYVDVLTKVATADAALLSTLLRGAAVEKVLKSAQVLYLKVLKASGTNETSKSIFGSNVKHAGGVVVNFMLFNQDGTVKLSSVETAYSGEKKDLPES